MNPFKALAIKLRDQGIAGLFPTKNRTSLRDLHPDNISDPMLPEYGVQPSEPWPRNDGPPPEGYENPIESRRATSTPGIHYPGDVEVGRLAAERVNERFSTISEQDAMRSAYDHLIGQPINDHTRAQVEAITADLNNSGYQITTVSLNPMDQRQNPGTRTQGDPMAQLHPRVGLGEPTARSCKGCFYCIRENIYCEACDRGLIHNNRPLGALPIIDRFISKDNQDYLYNEWKKKTTKRIKKEAMQELLDEMKNEKKIFKRNKLDGIIKYASAPDMRHKC